MGQYDTYDASSDFGVIQSIVDTAFSRAASHGQTTIERADILLEAQIQDVSPDVQEIVEMLPPGRYGRVALADQLNSAITAHGWSTRLGTVE